jgi:hypothetical protein
MDTIGDEAREFDEGKGGGFNAGGIFTTVRMLFPEQLMIDD